MPDSYAEILRRKRTAVVAEIEELRLRLGQVTSQIATKEGQLRNLEELLALEEQPKESDQSTRSASVAGGRIPDLAIEILRAAGEPIHYREIARRLRETGVHIPGQDPAANLLTQIARDDRYGRTARRGVYGLTEWPSLRAAGTRPRLRPTRRARSHD